MYHLFMLVWQRKTMTIESNEISSRKFYSASNNQKIAGICAVLFAFAALGMTIYWL